MKKYNSSFSSVLAATMLMIGTTGIAYAYDGPKGHGGPCGPDQFRDHHRGPDNDARKDRMNYMMNRLELDQQQREAIKKIRDEQMAKMRTKMDEMKKIREAMREQAFAEKYDAAKVRELADAKAKLMSDMMVERMETMNRIRQLLTEQQEARMEQMKARMMQRRPPNSYR
jgi:Spy/CpxP family protein refolding chaperone